MAQHRRARTPGGAAGVEQGRELLRVGQRRHGAYDVRAQLGEGVLALARLGTDDHHDRSRHVTVGGQLGQPFAYDVEGGRVGDHEPGP